MRNMTVIFSKYGKRNNQKYDQKIFMIRKFWYELLTQDNNFTSVSLRQKGC